MPYYTLPILTFFAFQGHSRLQIVHLHLQALQGEVVLTWLPLVGDEHEDDDDEKEASASSDAHYGRKRQQAVGHDVDSTRRDVETADLNLRTVATLAWVMEGNERSEASEVDASSPHLLLQLCDEF